MRTKEIYEIKDLLKDMFYGTLGMALFIAFMWIGASLFPNPFN